ncbi:MAG: hypothetical protein PHC62_03945 [Candidatus Izemoplasmatales bacterium]|nr:hypothetical protein [Candidatus Izemoplasmatales bacterium]
MINKEILKLLTKQELIDLVLCCDTNYNRIQLFNTLNNYCCKKIMSLIDEQAKIDVISNYREYKRYNLLIDKWNKIYDDIF